MLLYLSLVRIVKKNIIEALEENKAIKGPVDFQTQYRVEFSNK